MIVFRPLADSLVCLSVCLFVLRPDSVCPFSPPHCSICCSCIKQPPGGRQQVDGYVTAAAAQRLTANLQKNKEATVGQRDGLKIRGTERRGKGGRRLARERERLSGAPRAKCCRSRHGGANLLFSSPPFSAVFGFCLVALLVRHDSSSVRGGLSRQSTVIYLAPFILPRLSHQLFSATSLRLRRRPREPMWEISAR